MTVIELIRAFAHDASVAVVLTDAAILPPGPIILYANEAFGRLVGRSTSEVIGLHPRFMQGRETRRPSLDLFAQALASGERFHGFLTNYRGDGPKYVVEIDCRPLRNAAGQVEFFLAFEREVIRRRGRPFAGTAGRFEPLAISNNLLGNDLRRLDIFAELVVPTTDLTYHKSSS